MFFTPIPIWVTPSGIPDSALEAEVKSSDSESKQSWVQIPTLLSPRRVTLGKLLNFDKLLFPHLGNGDNGGIFFIELMGRVNMTM